MEEKAPLFPTAMELDCAAAVGFTDASLDAHLTPSPPKGTKVALLTSTDFLHIRIPSTGHPWISYFFFAIATVYLAGGVFMAWQAMQPEASTVAFLVLAVICLGSCATLVGLALRHLFFIETVSLSADEFRISREVLGWRDTCHGQRKDISGVRLGGLAGPQRGIVIMEGVREHVVGQKLSFAEQRWLLAELNQFLQVPLY